jgi:hypothetical protein
MNSTTIAIVSAILVDNVYTHIWTKYILKYPTKFSPIQVLQSTYLSSLLYVFIVFFHKIVHQNIIDASAPGHIQLLSSALIPETSTITFLSSLKITLVLWAVFIAPTLDFFIPQSKQHQYLAILIGSCARYTLITAALTWNL